MNISNNAPLLDGWINQDECDLVLKYMKICCDLFSSTLNLGSRALEKPVIIPGLFLTRGRLCAIPADSL